MGTITLTIPAEVKSELKVFSWVNWSEVAQDESTGKAEMSMAFERFKKLISKSKFTEKDAEELSNKVKSAMHKRLKVKGLV